MIAAIARRLQPLRRDRRGASAAEFGLTLPLWIILIFAALNIGRFYWARAGLQNGLGEAARTATLWPSRDVATIRSSFNARTFGLTATEAPRLTITPGTANGRNFVDLQVTYNPQFFLLFVPVAPVTLTYSRRAYRSDT